MERHYLLLDCQMKQQQGFPIYPRPQAWKVTQNSQFLRVFILLSATLSAHVCYWVYEVTGPKNLAITFCVEQQQTLDLSGFR